MVEAYCCWYITECLWTGNHHHHQSFLLLETNGMFIDHQSSSSSKSIAVGNEINVFLWIINHHHHQSLSLLGIKGMFIDQSARQLASHLRATTGTSQDRWWENQNDVNVVTHYCKPFFCDHDE